MEIRLVEELSPIDSVFLAYAPPDRLARLAIPSVARPRLAILIPALAPAVTDEALLGPAGEIAPARHLSSGVPGLAGDPPVPIFGPLESLSPPFTREDVGGVRRLLFRFDLIANVFLHVSRLEETLTRERDRFGRFSSSQSLLARHGILRTAPVDRLAAYLARLIVREHPDEEALLALRALWPGGEPSAVLLTHDVDQSVSWPRRLARDLASAGRALVGAGGGDSHAGNARSGAGGDPYDSGHPRGLREAVARTARHLAAPNRDPALFPRAVQAYERANGLSSSWFFLTVPRDSEGRRYRVGSPPFRRLLAELQAAGSEVGLHGSIQASGDAEAMEAERRAIEAVLGTSVEGNRQHYLVVTAPATFRNLALAGLRYDASVGYADAVGFRAGTSLPFRPYDLECESPIDLIEIPLGVMDLALIAPGQEGADAEPLWRDLLDRQSAVGGLLSVLWHPRMFDTETHPAGRGAYEALVREARGRALPFLTAGEIARWWRAREGLRLVAIERPPGSAAAGLALRYESREPIERATIVIPLRDGAAPPRPIARGAEIAASSHSAGALSITLAGIPRGGFEVHLQ